MPDPAPTILFAVRHGETEWNAAGRAQGHFDSPLTDLGEQQALAVAGWFEHERIDALYVSDLRRAIRTAEAIADRARVKTQVDERLRERNLGAMEGLTRQDLEERYPEDFARLRAGDPDHRFEGGETSRERYERVVACVEDLVSRHPGERILLVTHGGVVKSLLQRALVLPLVERPVRFSIWNAAVNRFTIRGASWRLDTWGDVSHLRALRDG